MRLKQVSVFLENSPGHLKRACDILAAAKINLRTIMIAESKSFGIMRAIVDKPEEAVAALAKEGIVAKLVDVLAVDVPDVPGALAKILDTAEKNNVNIEYMYALTQGNGGSPTMVMYFTDIEKAEKMF